MRDINRPDHDHSWVLDYFEGVNGDVIQLAEMMERFMVGTLNGDRVEAGAALAEVQEFVGEGSDGH